MNIPEWMVKAAWVLWYDDNGVFDQVAGQAVDAIAAIIAQHAPKDEWIAVSERLPEVPGYVLIVGRDGVEPDQYMHSPEYTGWINGQDVTHWRPLPAPPEAK